MLPNSTDINALRVFFEKHQFHNTYELAALTNKSPSVIEEWRNRCGMKSGKKPPTTVKREFKPKDYEPIDVTVWDNKEWLMQKYTIERLGLPTVARMVKRSVTLIRKKLQRYGIPTRDLQTSMASKNPHCTKEWLVSTYVNDGWTLRECAEVADVSPHTISKWLAKFNLDIRDVNEAMAGNRNPFFGRRHSEQTKERLRRAYKESGNPLTRAARGIGAIAEVRNS